MKIWKDKKGEKISFKEFMKRFKEGIETINPLQKIKIQLGGTKIMLIGLFLGLFVSIYGWRNLWWVGIILIGAILNTGVQFLGLRQQKKILDDLEKQFAEPDEDNSQETNLEDMREGSTLKDTHALKKSESSPDEDNQKDKEVE